MKETSPPSMMVQDIYLIMKLNVFSKEHGEMAKSYVGLKPSQMVMYMRECIKEINFMDLDYCITILEVSIDMKVTIKIKTYKEILKKGKEVEKEKNNMSVVVFTLVDSRTI